MKLVSDYVGKRCAPLDVVVGLRHSMNFAAAIEDDNPAYLDDCRPGGIVAPPMLAVALTWRISSQPASFWAGTDFPVECLSRQVHYCESLEWRRLMRPGDRLCIEGECKAILPHKSGTLILLEYRAIDGDGEAVFIERIGGLLRDVCCADEGSGQEFMLRPQVILDAGAPLWEHRVYLGRLAAHHYDAGADIHFPIHSSVAYARAAGLPGILYQGTATLARAMKELTNREAEGNAGRVRSVECGFGAMVFPGSDITIQLLGREAAGPHSRLHFQVLTAEGKAAIRQGVLVVGPESASAAPD